MTRPVQWTLALCAILSSVSLCVLASLQLVEDERERYQYIHAPQMGLILKIDRSHGVTCYMPVSRVSPAAAESYLSIGPCA